MNNEEFEKKLATLQLTQPSEDYLQKGVEVIHSGQQNVSLWQRYLPVFLASALVISVSVNVFQLVNSQQQLEALQTEQLALCTTPAASISPTKNELNETAALEEKLNIQGIC